MILEDKALQYCRDVISGKEPTTEEVIKQCKLTLKELKEQSDEGYPYFLDIDMVEKVEGILSIINFATGINNVIGTPVIDGLHGFQAYFFYSVFGWKFKSNNAKYRYNYITLFVPRKNAKSWMAAICLLIFLLTEDDYSEFYSICHSKELAGEIKKAMVQVIEASPLISKHFKISTTLSGQILCKLTNSFYKARVSEPNKNNAVRSTCFIADEIGAFTTKANILAMKSGQKNVVNGIQINCTTAYAEDKSIMIEELDYIRKVFNGVIKNDRMFALLYYATEEHLWDDEGLAMCNPLRIEDNYNTIREERQSALDKPSEREEYLTKDMNHFMPKNSGTSFIKIEDLRKCKVNTIDWTGRDIFLGLDLALTNDNCSYSMATYLKETDEIYADSYAFIPKDRIEEKNKFEKTNYYEHIKSGKCFACGDLTVNYLFIEQKIMEIEEKHGVHIIQIGYDISNCLSTANKLEAEGIKTVKIRQHSDTLHMPTKLLEEYILSKKFHYTENKLLEENFANAKVRLDETLRKYVSKKASAGKVDMVVSLIIALYLLQQKELLNKNSFVVQC